MPHELSRLHAREISIVPKAANARRFLLLKTAGLSYPEVQLVAEIEHAIRDLPAAERKAARKRLEDLLKEPDDE